jgi:GR25 family glycosyltransferase involved in LPS biosynthesis
MKTYILHIDREKSKKYSRECLESYLKVGMNPEKVVMFEGLSGLNNSQLREMTGYHIHTDMYASEYCSTVGHIAIWKAIVQSNEIGVVLEHDAIVKGDYSRLKPKDGVLLFLGPRVFNRDDYQLPAGYSDFEIVDASYHHGAHAYMITPGTAQMMLDIIAHHNEIFMPIDGLLGLKNKFVMDIQTVDPAPVIAEIGNDRESFNFDKPDPSNRNYTRKFLDYVPDKSKLPATLDFIFEEDNFSHNIPLILKSFLLTNKNVKEKMSILDIDTKEGRSSVWFVDNVARHFESNVDIVSLFLESERQEKRYLYNLALTANVNKTKSHKGHTHDFFKQLFLDDKKYDVIYIDGNPETIIHDMIMCFHLLKDDGVIIVNNYKTEFMKYILDKIEKTIPIEPIVQDLAIAYVKKG